MAIISKARKVRTKAGSGGRRRAAASLQAKGCTAIDAGINFLKSSFAPVYSHRPQKDARAMEQEFFTSFHHFCDTYQITPSPVSHLPFPTNILWAFMEAVRTIKAADEDCELLIAESDAGTTCLVTEKPLYTGHRLYYIPVWPVARLLSDTGQQPLAMLLLSVFAYLLQIVKVPHFRNFDSYLYDTYCSIEEWIVGIEEEWDSALLDSVKNELHSMKTVADRLLHRMEAKRHLLQFKRRVQLFKADSPIHTEAIGIAKETLALWQDYPHTSIWNYMPLENEDECYDSDAIRLDQYLSFFWSDEGTLFDYLDEHVNAELQELGAIKEPVARQVFDRCWLAPEYDHDYCERLFPIIQSLCTLLFRLT